MLAREPVILAGNVVAVVTLEGVQPPSLKVTVLTFQVKNGKMKLYGESIFF